MKYYFVLNFATDINQLSLRPFNNSFCTSVYFYIPVRLYIVRSVLASVKYVGCFLDAVYQDLAHLYD